jgi:hypothetical protein
MKNEKPVDICEYKEWLEKFHACKIDQKLETHYNSAVTKIHQDVSSSPLWHHLADGFKSFNQDYFLRDSFYLFQSNELPVIDKKTFDSFLLKTFRKNIIDNKDWPNPPQKEWILPNNWLTKINDIVRTLFVVKYLDGVEYLIEKIKAICESNNLEFKVDYEAKDEGYYAAHVYTKCLCDIPKSDWDTDKIEISFEIQITTQLQEVIRKLLHKYYEVKRKELCSSAVKWQWDYKSNEFSANYLGHILHYVEGMIMDVRDKK